VLRPNMPILRAVPDKGSGEQPPPESRRHYANCGERYPALAIRKRINRDGFSATAEVCRRAG